MKNEISAHAFATIRQVPEVRTIFEIGGQDSKIILIRDKIVIDFGMNSVCAAGTGSFLDHQAERLGIDITSTSRRRGYAIGQHQYAQRTGQHSQRD